MKYSVFVFLFIAIGGFAQQQLRCPVCPPAQGAAVNGYCLTIVNGAGVWAPCGGSGAGNFWKTTGNAGTVAGTNFVGTTDNIDFVVKSNTTERMRFLGNGQFQQQLRGLATIYLNNNQIIIADTTAGVFLGLNPADTSQTHECGTTTMHMSPNQFRASCYHSASDYSFGINAINADESGEVDDVRIFARHGEDKDSGCYMRVHIDEGIGFYNAGELKVRIDTSGKLTFVGTINSSAGDAATINGSTGKFRKDASGTTFTLTNNFITANSSVLLQINTVGLTAGNNVVAVAGAGSVVVTFQNGDGSASAPNANTDVTFWVIN